MKEINTKRQINKFKDFLATSGYAIIVLTIWTFIKSVIYFRYVIPRLTDYSEQNWSVAFIIYELAYAIVSLATGFIAKNYGKNLKKENILILVLSIVLFLLNLLGIAAEIYISIMYKEISLVSILSYVGDGILLVFNLQMIISIFKLKSLYKINKEANYER